MPVAIMGDRACGKTVFLGLLYQAQEDYTNNFKYNEERNDFRFNGDPVYINKMSQVVNNLRKGYWVEATLKGSLVKYSFTMGYGRTLRNPFGESANRYDTIDFAGYDVAGEDMDMKAALEPYINAFQEKGEVVKINYNELSPTLQSLLECNVLVFLIDLSRINAKPRTPDWEKMLDYDALMATLISLVARYKGEKYKDDPKKNAVFPVFVLTKFDTILNTGVLENLGFPDELPPKPDSNVNFMVDKLQKKNEQRIELAEKIMIKYYSHAFAQARGGVLRNVNFDRAGYFFSWLKPNYNDRGQMVPSIDAEGHLVFSYDEYKSFIDYFRFVARKMSEKDLSEQEFNDQYKKRK